MYSGTLLIAIKHNNNDNNLSHGIFCNLLYGQGREWHGRFEEGRAAQGRAGHSVSLSV